MRRRQRFSPLGILAKIWRARWTGCSSGTLIPDENADMLSTFMLVSAYVSPSLLIS